LRANQFLPQIDVPARILIDGRSGSGKTELASALVADWPGAQLVRLDDLYPGWDGLDAASTMVHTTLLRDFRWQRWDWATDQAAEWHTLDPLRPLVIEGCGALTASSRALATLALWVELDTPTRKRRALARDGHVYTREWDRWAAQEERFLVRENPLALADAVLDGLDVTGHLAQWRDLLPVGADSMGE
jgi:adenylate kinase family enzyme